MVKENKTNNKIKNKYDDETEAPLTSSLGLLFILIVPLACIFIKTDFSGIILPISYLVGMILVVYSKVKYPTNKFTKGVFVFAMITLAFVILLIQLISSCMSCPG